MGRVRTLAKLAAVTVAATAAAALLLASVAHAAAIVVNANTGEVLFADGADRGHYPASLTKMMTLYMTFEALDQRVLNMAQELPISASAANQIPSRLGLRRGQTIAVEDAILALITKSANDVAVVLAEALYGTESNFAVAMTMRARDLGLYRTAFRNASGLHDRYQYTTPRDMANLAIALVRDFPQYYPLFATPAFTYDGITYTNHNALLSRYAGTDGIKTGYIRASGYNLVASVRRGGTRLVGVVLGGDSAAQRDRTMAGLFDEAFLRLHLLDGPAGLRPAAEPALSPAAAVATTPAAPRQEAPVVAMASTGPAATWAVQVGAYRDYGGAQRRMQEAALALPIGFLNARPVIEAGGGDLLYHARLTGLTQPQARDACRILGPTDIPCLMVAPAPVPPAFDRATAIADIQRLLEPLARPAERPSMPGG